MGEKPREEKVDLNNTEVDTAQLLRDLIEYLNLEVYEHTYPNGNLLKYSFKSKFED